MSGRTHGVTLEGGRFLVAFDYDPRLVKSIKRVPGALYLGESKQWSIPNRPGSAEALHQFAAFYALPTTPAAQGALDRAIKSTTRTEVASAATDMDFEIPGVVETMTPMGYQRAGVAYAVKQRRTFIADQPGLGKTGQAIMAAAAADAFPALIVAPAVLKVNWAREVGKWLGPSRSTAVLSGQSPHVIGNPDFVVINYDILHFWACRAAKQANWNTVKVEGRHWAPGPLTEHGFRTLIFDESHYLRNENLRYAGALQLSRAVDDDGLILMLTGTPVVVGPVDLIAQLEIMRRMKDFGGKAFFLRRYCGVQRIAGRLDTTGSTNRVELHQRLRSTCYVRRQKHVVLAGQLPPKFRNPVMLPVTPEGIAEYKAAEDDVVSYLTNRAESLANEAGVDPKSARIQARLRAESALHLVRLAALKRLAAMAKMPAVIEWLDEFLNRPTAADEQPRKIILFAHHRPVLQALYERTRPFGSTLVIGGMTDGARQAAIDAFQDDPKIRVIVCALTAASIGLTLTAASDVAFVEMGWTPSLHEQAEDRAHRIGQQDEVNAWYLLGEGTLDREVYDLVEGQRRILDEISDGLEPGVEDEEGGGAVGKTVLQRVLDRNDKEKVA